MQVPGQSTRPARSPRILEFPRLVPPTSRLLVPREHGSWGLWLLPLISGAIVGCVLDPHAAAEPVFWFGVAAASGFLIYQPMEILLGLSLVKAPSQRQQRTALLWIIVFTIAGACSVLELLYLQRFLVLLIGAVALGCFGMRSLFGRSRRVRVLKQLIGALVLTSTAAGAYYAAAWTARHCCFGWRHGSSPPARSNTCSCACAQRKSGHPGKRRGAAWL